MIRRFLLPALLAAALIGALGGGYALYAAPGQPGLQDLAASLADDHEHEHEHEREDDHDHDDD